MAGKISCCFVKPSKISHLGVNPVRGGSPARENKAKIMAIINIGFFDQSKVRALIFIDGDSFRAKKAVMELKI